MEKFKKLKVWQKAHRLVLEVYKITINFPSQEKFALVPQMRRAAISVASNIVEGTKRKSVKDRKHFHNMSETSLEELKYYFLLSYELKYIDLEIGITLNNMAREIGAMLESLNKAL
ncbi:MAG: four helix bundle protein [bacterium]|nr:four helix bundle protein [bacterium]